MKKKIGLTALLLAVLFVSSGCAIFSGIAATGDSKDYKALANEKSFEAFFPAITAVYNFKDLDEAYDFVNTAHAKFTSSSGKNRAKGLAAKLNGPKVENKGKPPVTVCYFMEAWTADSEIDLTKINEPLEKVIKDAIAAMLFFMIFNEDRAVVLSNYHLVSGREFNSNSQQKYFTYNGAEYIAEFPFGWGTSKAFSYLKKEID
jgi:hypothetical protein